MRLVCLFCATTLVLAALANHPAPARKPAQANPPETPADGDLIVHEWGTFTNFSGSDGVNLEFRPLVDNDLPPFVRNWAIPNGLSIFSKRRLRARQRMETPVTYFYTDREREVRVRVGFPQGLLTEFFPPVRSVKPVYDSKATVPMQNGLLDWGTVRLIPPDRFRLPIADQQLAQRIQPRIIDGLLPQVVDANHYVHARETDSAIVHVAGPTDTKNIFLPPSDSFEKFLFYRGIGNFELPLSLGAVRGSQFQLTNTGPDQVRSLFLVTVDGKQLRFSKYDEIRPGQTLALQQSSRAATVKQLAEAVVDSLIAEGLYQKEAQAMVKTWQSSWFGEQGSRLFFMLPARVTDEMLPLQIDPPPTQLVRVMVGRLEIMTPEDEVRVAALLQDNAARRAAVVKAKGDSAALKLPVPQRLREMGRLAEPALARVKHVSKDPTIRVEAALLLAQLQAADEESSE